MTDEIMKLAKRCGYSMSSHPMNPGHIFPSELETFYTAAFNRGIAAAATVPYGMGDDGCYSQIKGLEKPVDMNLLEAHADQVEREHTDEETGTAT